MKAQSRNASARLRNQTFQESFFKRFLCALSMIAAIGFAHKASAAEAGTIKGTVKAATTASTGASSEAVAVAGAKIILVNLATPGKPLTVLTNPAGEFIFGNLPGSDYTPEIETPRLSG